MMEYLNLLEDHMHIDSSFAGTMLREYQTTVNWRHAMNYAAALNDTNEAYYDDERPGGIVAHPMYCAALTWPIVERVGEFIDSKDFPKELLATQVHFTESLTMYRPVVPGDTLTIRGRVDQIEPHRAGTHVIIRFEAIDAGGQRVFVEHIGGLMRGVECRGGARGADGPSEFAPIATAPAEGNVRESNIAISALVPFVYDGCSNIYFPIHTSKKFARQVGLPGIIVQGTATLAMAVSDIIAIDAYGDPGRIMTLQCRFTDMVMPGSNITLRVTAGTRTELQKELFFTVLNEEGRAAIRNGFIRIAADKRRES
jgi:acyl dehydratase